MHEKELYPFDIQKSFWLRNKLFDIIISTLCLTGRWVVTYTCFLIRSILQRNSLPPTFIISIVPSLWQITNCPVWHFQKNAFQISNFEFIVTYFSSLSWKTNISILIRFRGISISTQRDNFYDWFWLSFYILNLRNISFSFEIWYCHQTTYGRNNLQKMSNFFCKLFIVLENLQFQKAMTSSLFLSFWVFAFLYFNLKICKSNAINGLDQ